MIGRRRQSFRGAACRRGARGRGGARRPPWRRQLARRRRARHSRKARRRHAPRGARRRQAAASFSSHRDGAALGREAEGRSSPAARSSSCIAILSCMTICPRWTMTTRAAAGRPCTRPSTRRPPSSAGDALLTLAFELMASGRQPRPKFASRSSLPRACGGRFRHGRRPDARSFGGGPLRTRRALG